MTTPYVQPSGAPDFAAQAEGIQRDRDQLEQEQVLARQQREQRPAAAPLYHETLTAMPAAGPVIDPTGAEYEKDEDGYALEDSDGQPIPVGDYERDTAGIALLDNERRPIPVSDEYERGDDGVVLRDDSGRPFEKWPHTTIEYKGMQVQIKPASTEVLNALSMAMSDNIPAETQNRINRQFVDGHISLRSRVEIMSGLMAGTFTMADYGEITKEIAKAGTNRPTRRSKR